VIDQRDALAIAKKLQAVIKLGRAHDIAAIWIDGIYVCQFGIRRGSGSMPHDYIARQLHVSHRDAAELARCTMSRDQYVTKVREKGLLNPRSGD
jgi:hypothetical protein